MIWRAWQDGDSQLDRRLISPAAWPTRACGRPPQRLLVLQTLAAEPHDATAQEIHARLREGKNRIGLATVYRALAVLKRRGVVDELSHRAGRAAIGSASPAITTTWFASAATGSRSSKAAAPATGSQRASRRHGFQVASHTVEVFGLCAACRAA